MIPPIFTLLSSNSAVTNIIGTSPVRCYPAGNIPQVPIDQQSSVVPCVVWQSIAGTVENLMSDRPPSDHQRIQIDCWALAFSDAQTLADVVQSALELSGQCVSLNGHDYDAETKRYRVSIDYAFWTSH